MANHHNEGGTWSLYKVTAEQVLEKVKIIEEGSATLGAYATEIIALSVSRGHLARA
ncbi:hypothetical protein GCM10018952_42830 [Streptosporangium vulgare]